MTADHDSYTHTQVPLGESLPCGCVGRALLFSCRFCGLEQWVGTATDVPVGDVVMMRGTCWGCGGTIDGRLVVHAQPTPSTFGRG